MKVYVTQVVAPPSLQPRWDPPEPPRTQVAWCCSSTLATQYHRGSPGWFAFPPTRCVGTIVGVANGKFGPDRSATVLGAGSARYDSLMAEVAWTAIGMLGATLFGSLFWLGSRIDGLGSRIDGLSDRIDAQGASLSERIDAQGASLGDRIDAQGASLSARIDAYGASLDAQGASLGARIDAQGASLGARIDSLEGRMAAGFDAVNARLDAHLQHHA